jgi:hypothetical protein
MSLVQECMYEVVGKVSSDVDVIRDATTEEARERNGTSTS